MPTEHISTLPLFSASKTPLSAQPSALQRNIYACYLSDIVLGSFFQLPIWVVYQSQFLSYSQIAWYAGIALLAEVVAQLPTGAFADRYGRRLALSLGNLFMALPMFLIAFFPRPEIMLLYSLLWGLGRAFAMGTSKPMLYDTLLKHHQVERYPKLLSNSVLFFQFSAALSILAGGYLYQLSPQLPYIVSGVTSLIGVGVSFLFVENVAERTVDVVKNKFWQTAKLGWLEIFKNSYVTTLTFLYVLALGISQTSQQFFIQPYMVELGMSDIERSWAAMIIKIGIAVVGARALASARVSQHRYFLLLIPLLMVFSLLPAKFISLPLAYLVFIGIAFNSGNTDLFLSAEVNAQIDSRVRSTAISVLRMLASAIGALTQWLSIGVVAAHSVGTYYSILGIFSLLILVPIAMLVVSRNHRFA